MIVHIFRTDLRQVYSLEKLWSDAKRVNIPAERITLVTDPDQPLKKRPVRRATKSR